MEDFLRQRTPRGWKLITFKPFDDERWSAVWSTPLKGDNAFVGIVFKRSEGYDRAAYLLDKTVTRVQAN